VACGPMQAPHPSKEWAPSYGDRDHASSPLDSALLNRKVEVQSSMNDRQIELPERPEEGVCCAHKDFPEEERCSSPFDTELMQRRVAQQQRRQFRPLQLKAELLTPLLQQTVRTRLHHIIQQQQKQQVDQLQHLTEDTSGASSSPLPISSASSSPKSGIERLGPSSPVDSLLLERKVLRQQRKRAGHLDGVGDAKEDVGNSNSFPGLWLSGVDLLDAELAAVDASSRRSSPLLERDHSTPWGSPRKLLRASPGA